MATGKSSFFFTIPTVEGKPQRRRIDDRLTGPTVYSIAG
jgi:hypothetical protein